MTTKKNAKRILNRMKIDLPIVHKLPFADRSIERHRSLNA